MRKQVFIFIFVAIASIFLLRSKIPSISSTHQFNTLIIKNTNARILYPHYRQRESWANVALAPIPIPAGNSSTLKSKDGSMFKINAQYADINNLSTIDVTLVISSKGNSFIVKQTGGYYKYSYTMTCGGVTVKNSVIKEGSPCQIELLLEDTDKLYQSSNFQQVNAFILHSTTKNNVKKFQDNQLQTNFGFLNEVVCILQVYFDDQLVCQEQLQQTDNNINGFNGFKQVDYTAGNGNKIDYQSWSQDGVFSFRLWDDGSSQYGITLGGPSICLEGQYVLCQGTMIASKPTITLGTNFDPANIQSNLLVYFADMTISAAGINDMYPSTYAFLQIVESGQRYLQNKVTGEKVKDVLEPLYNCVDDSIQGIYFSQAQVNPSGSFKFQMNDPPSNTICKSDCLYDKNSNTIIDVELIGKDYFSTYLVRKINSESNTDTPILQKIAWGYEIKVGIVDNKWTIKEANYKNQEETVNDIPTWTSDCLSKRNVGRVQCQYIPVLSRQCWVVVNSEQQASSKESKESKEDL